jgi:N-acyl-D-aspartate/D-glutamate deacylase
VSAGKIVAVGEVKGSGRDEIDARGYLVTPGFVDVHTHYDGQATWEQRLSPSSTHGVTTVLAGNCGVGFAPCKPQDRERLVRLMEGVEDVPEVVMAAGLPWNWESFPDYLDVLASRRLDIDVATQIPHSPLRVYVMGERGANREPATAEDLAEMTRLVAESVRAGAIGVSTSRLLSHRSADGTPIPSLQSARDELRALGDGLRRAQGGVFQLVPDYDAEPEHEVSIMRDVAAQSGRPLSFSLVQSPMNPDYWKRYVRAVHAANNAGYNIKGQVFPRPIGMMFGLDLSFNPFCRRPSWSSIASLPLKGRVAALRDPSFRERILAERDAEHPMPQVNMMLARLGDMVALGDPPDYLPSHEKRLAFRAARAGKNLFEFALDEMLNQEGQAVLYLPAGNYAAGNMGAARALMDDTYTVLGLGDGGAHYGLVCDASYPTTMLSYWGRDAAPADRMPIERVVSALSREPAAMIGLSDRGVIAPGMLADVNVIDHDRLVLHAPRVKYDLPGGGRRLTQAASGYVATLKRGTVTYRDGAPTDALPGTLLRRPQAATATAPR